MLRFRSVQNYHTLTLRETLAKVLKMAETRSGLLRTIKEAERVRFFISFYFV